MTTRLINRAIVGAALLASGSAQAVPLHQIVARYGFESPEPGLITLFALAAALLFMSRRRKPSA